MRGKWLLISGIVILAAIGAGALSLLRKPAVPEAKKASSTSELPALGDEISAIARIQAAHIVPVPAPVDGTLDSWEVEPGQDVLEEQQLGFIKNSSLQAAQDLAQAEVDRAQTRITNLEGSILAAKLESARAEGDSSRAASEADRLQRLYTREQMLVREGALPRLKFEKTERDYQAAKTEAESAARIVAAASERIAKLEKDLELARKTLEDRTGVLEEAKSNTESATIVSPVDGTVISVRVEAGGEVDRGMHDLVQLAVDPAILDAIVEPEQRVLEAIQPGMPALVYVTEVSDEGLAGEVKEVKDNQVKVEFTSPNPAIKHGMMGSVRIKLIPQPSAQPRPASATR